MYLIIYEVIGYTEEKNGSILDSIDENKEVWNKIDRTLGLD